MKRMPRRSWLPLVLTLCLFGNFAALAYGQTQTPNSRQYQQMGFTARNSGADPSFPASKSGLMIDTNTYHYYTEGMDPDILDSGISGETMLTLFQDPEVGEAFIRLHGVQGLTMLENAVRWGYQFEAAEASWFYYGSYWMDGLVRYYDIVPGNPEATAKNLWNLLNNPRYIPPNQNAEGKPLTWGDFERFSGFANAEIAFNEVKVQICDLAAELATELAIELAMEATGGAAIVGVTHGVLRFVRYLIKRGEVDKAAKLLAKFTSRVAPSTKPKPYSNPRNRPKYGKGQVDDVWENAKQADGKVYDPNTGAELTWDPTKPRTRQWNMGHKPGKKYSDLHKDYMDGKITKEEFLREYRDPNNYWPEDWLENQSHKWE